MTISTIISMLFVILLIVIASIINRKYKDYIDKNLPFLKPITIVLIIIVLIVTAIIIFK